MNGLMIPDEKLKKIFQEMWGWGCTDLFHNKEHSVFEVLAGRVELHLLVIKRELHLQQRQVRLVIHVKQTHVRRQRPV